MAATDPHSYADTEQGRIQHISLQIEIDFDQRVFHIRADYRLDRRVSGLFFLDCSGQDIKRVQAGTHSIAWKKDPPDAILGERLRLIDLRGEQAFTIEFTTSARASALQWLDPAQTAGGKHPFVYSQCQAIHARSIFPCQDTPSVRITYDAQVSVPSGLTAVMAAAPTGVQRDGAASAYSFRMPQPIPSYLFAIAVGELGFKALGPRTGIYAEPSVLDAAVWEFAENERKIIEAEKLFGPYLWDRYDLLIMPPSFPYGGMENPRLTFLTPTSLVGDRSNTPLITHELAHSWTGNLVTNATWGDFWLNEGWTTYAEVRISEVVEGEDQTQLGRILYLDLLRAEVQQFGSDSPHTRLKDPMEGEDPDLLVSGIPYYKGSFFLSRLEELVGRAAFDEFVHRYIATYKFQSVTTEGFIEFLKQELPAAAERVNLHAWIYEPGMPVDIPAITSTLYEDVQRRGADYTRTGVLPDRDDVRGWHYLQKRMFLRLLPRTIPADHCGKIAALFGFEPDGNIRLLYEFYRTCIRSGYRDALPGIEHFVEKVGRHAFLVPVIRTMTETEWTRDLVRPMFERYRHRHHPITVAAVDGVLAQAGL